MIWAVIAALIAFLVVAVYIRERFVAAGEHGIAARMSQLSDKDVQVVKKWIDRDQSLYPIAAEVFWRRLSLTRETTGGVETPMLVALDRQALGMAAVVRMIPGQEINDFSSIIDRIGPILGVHDVRISEDPDVPGQLQILAVSRDPLKDPVTGENPSESEDMSIPWGIGEDGTAVSIPLIDMGGVVVGGLSGTGKSAGLAASIGALFRSDEVQFGVVDGKGCGDWSWCRSRVWFYTGEDEDLTVARDRLAQVHGLMRGRMKRLEAEGRASVWPDGVSREWPLIVLVIDECQTYLDVKSQFGRDSKEISGEIISLVTSLVRKGRAAGIVTILVTQKPTADAIPTAIRDLCGFRISYAQATDDAAEAVLGSVVRGSKVSPVFLDRPPAGQGICVMGQSNGRLVRVKSVDIGIEELRSLASETAGLRRDPEKLLAAEGI